VIGKMELQYRQPKINDIYDLYEYIFTRQMSNYTYYLGVRESGKTDNCLYGHEIIHELKPKWLHGANITISKSPFPIEHITDLETLTRWCSLNKHIPKVFSIDEVGRNFPKWEWYKKKHIQLIGKLQVLRKYRLHVNMITQYTDVVSKGLMHPILIDGYFQKYSPEHKDRARYNDLYNPQFEPISFNKISRTAIKFGSYDVAPFTEKPIITKEMFPTETLKLLWEWSNGSTSQKLGIHRMELNRLVRKYVKDQLQSSHGVTNSA
jgi:hypothetical protein